MRRSVELSYTHLRRSCLASRRCVDDCVLVALVDDFHEVLKLLFHNVAVLWVEQKSKDAGVVRFQISRRDLFFRGQSQTALNFAFGTALRYDVAPLRCVGILRRRCKDNYKKCMYKIFNRL